MTWLITSVLLFLGLSLLIYVLLAGADFGAGILEIFVGKQRPRGQRELISKAMAPVWEANHVWIVLAVVILFMGFPSVYTTMSTYLFIPLTAVLMGIVGRGCAFTFRNYDSLSDHYYLAYTRIFAVSSLWTSFVLGVTTGALIVGRIDPSAQDFHALYVGPWLNSFCFVLGLFTCCLFALLAAVYLVGEAEDKTLRNIFRRRAAISAALLVALGPFVFLSAESMGLPLAEMFFTNPLSIACFVVATVLLVPFWRSLIREGKGTLVPRIAGVVIVTLVLLGWYAVQYPVAVRLRPQPDSRAAITFLEAAAPEATLRVLLGALVVGALIVFPALGYLLRVFKWSTIERERKPY